MEKNSITISGSFKGIAGTFLKRILILILVCIFYIIISNIKNQYYSEYNIESLWAFITAFTNFEVIAILSLIFIVYLILLWIFITVLYKTILLVYEIPKTTVIDFQNEKITSTTYSFPFSKQVDENKFNDIINVVISQDMMKRLFNSGHLYIEFLTYSKLDSQLRNIEITYVANPLKLKQELL
jgi:hypothetical protein